MKYRLVFPKILHERNKRPSFTILNCDDITIKKYSCSNGIKSLVTVNWYNAKPCLNIDLVAYGN
jgi:hypothetical protein